MWPVLALASIASAVDDTSLTVNILKITSGFDSMDGGGDERQHGRQRATARRRATATASPSASPKKQSSDGGGLTDLHLAYISAIPVCAVVAAFFVVFGRRLRRCGRPDDAQSANLELGDVFGDTSTDKDVA
jgi:hypothetical protein